MAPLSGKLSLLGEAPAADATAAVAADDAQLDSAAVAPESSSTEARLARPPHLDQENRRSDARLGSGCFWLGRARLPRHSLVVPSGVAGHLPRVQLPASAAAAATAPPRGAAAVSEPQVSQEPHAAAAEGRPPQTAPPRHRRREAGGRTPGQPPRPQRAQARVAPHPRYSRSCCSLSVPKFHRSYGDQLQLSQESTASTPAGGFGRDECQPHGCSPLCELALGQVSPGRGNEQVGAK